MQLRAGNLFKHNVDALLKRRGQTRHDLAMWCRRSDAWLSKILGQDDRNLPLKYLDRIADFFGLAAYQLFQPGITPLTERRSNADRRTGRDRRIAWSAQRTAASPMLPEDAAFLRRVNGLEYDDRRKLEHWLDAMQAAKGPGPNTALPGHRPTIVAEQGPPAKRARRRLS
jgi:hypothetical protein